jgi:tetratricopeptide (TPR) repeat protein
VVAVSSNYEKGISLEKNDPISAAFCYSNRAAAYSKLGKNNDATRDYNKAIELDPNNALRYQIRGFFNEQIQDYNNALIDYSKAIELAPLDPDNFYYRGWLYYSYLNNKDKALYDFEQAVKIDSTYVDAIVSIGSIYQEQGNLDDALIQFEKGIKFSFKDSVNLADCKSYRAYVYAEQGKFTLASKDFNESVNLDPSDATRYYDRGQFYENYLNDLNLALKDYSKAIELNAEEAYYYLARSIVFYQTSDVKSQMKDLDQAIKLDPEKQDYRCERALFIGVNGEIEKAIKEIDEAYLIDTTNTDVLLYKSKILIKNGDNDGAVKELDKVILKAPNDPEPYFIKAKLYELQGKNINAANNYSKAKTKLEVGDYYMTDDYGVMLEKSEIHAHIGKFYEKIGEKELMCEEYNEANKLLKKEYRYRYQSLKKDMEIKSQNCN